MWATLGRGGWVTLTAADICAGITCAANLSTFDQQTMWIVSNLKYVNEIDCCFWKKKCSDNNGVSECWLRSTNNVNCIKPTPATDRPILMAITVFKWCGNTPLNWQLLFMNIQMIFFFFTFLFFWLVTDLELAHRCTIFSFFLNCDIQMIICVDHHYDRHR